MRGRIHFRMQLHALGDRVVHASPHDSAMVHVLHVMRRRRRFFLFTLFTLSLEGSARCACCQQTHTPNSRYPHGRTPRRVSSRSAVPPPSYPCSMPCVSGPLRTSHRCIIANTQTIAAVIVNGGYYRPPDLHKKLNRVETAAQNEGMCLGVRAPL